MIRKFTACFQLLLLFSALVGPGIARQQTSDAAGRYIPQRVYDSDDKRFTDFEAMLADLSRADVVFVGEQHDDPATHRLELAILEGIARRRRPVVLALEMFERDVQPQLDDYLSGRLGEEEFLKNSRPWPRYATDYRPLVEFARAHNWRVLAANVPRRYASQVARTGLAALDTLPPAERAFIAQQIQCPQDDYFKRFAEQMSAHPGASSSQSSATQAPRDPKAESEHRAMTERFYHAQCIKDETMAESIANAYLNTPQPRPLIIHYNGAFHSDYRLGTASRTKQRLPKANIRVISVIPVSDLDTVKADEYRKRGDYLIFALKPVHKTTAPGD
jgi:uncharacterized iron-regulated protein